MESAAVELRCPAPRYPGRGNLAQFAERRAQVLFVIAIGLPQAVQNLFQGTRGTGQFVSQLAEI